jgi:hypothetical protein
LPLPLRGLSFAERRPKRDSTLLFAGSATRPAKREQEELAGFFHYLPRRWLCMAEAKIVGAEHTNQKICEKHYFLKRMGENRNDPNPFKFNFSAFLAALQKNRF